MSKTENLIQLLIQVEKQKARLFDRTFNTNDKMMKFKSNATSDLHQKTMTTASLHKFYLRRSTCTTKILNLFRKKIQLWQRS